MKKTLIRITLIAGFLSSSASALTPFDYHVVEVFRVPYFDNPIHVAIRTQEEWLAFANTVCPTVTGVPGAGHADSSLIEYPFADPFTNAHGIDPSAVNAEEAKATRTKPRRT